MLELAADPHHLGARTGVLAVLHTWGQTLQFHPHVHCVVPGGGLSPDRTCWVGSRPDFFLPIEVLSAVFRGKFLAGLRAASARGQLRLSSQAHNRRAANTKFERLVSAAASTDWVVHVKRPFAGPEVVLKYLARYTHRVAISNSRLLDFKDGFVRFRYKDYAHGSRKRVMKLTASSSCAGSCCMCCRRGSCGFAITASSRIAAGRRIWRCADSYSAAVSRPESRITATVRHRVRRRSPRLGLSVCGAGG